MFRPFWVGFPYFSLPFGGIPNRRDFGRYELLGAMLRIEYCDVFNF